MQLARKMSEVAQKEQEGGEGRKEFERLLGKRIVRTWWLIDIWGREGLGQGEGLREWGMCLATFPPIRGHHKLM